MPEPAGASPEATQLVPSQQPPPLQELPGQQAWPGAPQVVHWVPVHMPALHAAPLATQRSLRASQQPALQLEPKQHGWPGPPHC